uniref:Uncharacterized protein n=1 Tax=Biomphalaria glabrata TaxID=6526 RepID=A0A2C9LX21_BIOGL
MDADQFDLIKWTGKCEKAEGNNNHHNQFISAKLFINDLLPEAERDIEKMEQLRNQLIEKCNKDDAMFTRLIILINDMIHLSFRIEVDQGENTSRKGRFLCDGEDIKAITAAHIVEDESEARNSKVWINFNCPTMIDQKKKCVSRI